MEVSRADLREDSLKISVYDDEKYANDSQLGEVSIPLRELNFARDGEEHTTTLEFQEPKKVSQEINILDSIYFKLDHTKSILQH